MSTNRRIPFLAPVGLAALLLWAAAGHAAISADVEALIKRQAQVSASLAGIARSMNTDNAVEKRLQAVIHALAVSETVKAIESLEKIARAQTPANRAEGLAGLRQSQDRVIEMLERILGIVAQMKKQAAEPYKEEKSSDLSDIEKEKYRELSDKLKEFLKDQKKVIDGTTTLAKTAVEDFTPEQEQQLKQLEATEDNWSRFLKDTVSDLSKMAEQDMSNPALLNEIVEIYTEMEKAKDALTMKTLELAVPVEESAAEKAETLEYNLERWLMDTPDRTRWQMEEPLGDYEIPMAELPEELQDIVGELMEQEEDLMDDIEDATSGWADSIDKGAGWTAMDGPISNFSAKGVTGNMLPNKSEIGGRSGEGRTGRSSGEFVEKTAVGKGGRKTPTRLTGDAFEKGVVDDRSPDATGGATGGGKISGAGGEGLEGPVPPQIKQQLKALAGRQADLRNKAERVHVAFKNLNYPTEAISRTVRSMRGVEDALNSGNYSQVARNRSLVLKDFQDTRAFLAGETRINRDQSVNLPPELQDQIMDAMQEPSPKAYEDLLKAYFENLARPQ